MSGSPDGQPALSRRSVLTLVLLAAIAIAATLPFLPRASLLQPAPPLSVELAEPPGFEGASSARVFLSKAESAEAVRRGFAPPGTRSVLATGGKLDFGEWVWDDQSVPQGPIAVRVDLARQLVSVYKGRDEIGAAVIVYGVDGKETPRGKLPILGKTRDYHSRTYDAPMPFSLWLRGDGVALHGSSVSMGKATNGCIGVPVEFAEKLFAVAEKGDIIEVLGQPGGG